MKKSIITVFLIVLSQSAFAQVKTIKKVTDTKEIGTLYSDENYKKDLIKVIEKGEIGSQLTMVKDQVLKTIPSDKQAAFLLDFDASVATLYDKLVPIYMEAYTKEEIKSIVAFYDSSIGKKMTEKSAGINEKAQENAKEWGEGFQAIMVKYMQ